MSQDFKIQERVGFPGGSVVKNPPVMQELRVQSLGLKDPLEEEMTILSSILADIILKTNIKLHIGQIFKKKRKPTSHKQ